ncbi:MAG TPA: 2-succinyl-5-enolpyruvyl-6-hydroxy-3-cyclohexene-1-carboxylic-acid synthase [Streptosporangiaceae bacterium]|nr:2-succinyl-5-enolpyruvyl-6-hydroxy-3-cyclohexene-1-carboxylic-acid synthase [Streptosporangiaceae bacterium]
MNPSTAFATVLVDEFIRCGLRDAVIAPGSRSAPLALALHSAATAPGSPLRLHVRIDERSASFLALGIAKASGRPVAIVTTSGTAAAHCHAAVIEADEACVPLLVLTADRPPELRGTGANQTIDQLKLYGAAVRWFCEAGVPESRPGQAAYWRSLACRAWFYAAGNGAVSAGPVHLNLPLREPLVPGLADQGAAGNAEWCEPLTGRPGGAAWTQFDAAPLAAGAGADVHPVSALIVEWRQRGVVVAGDGVADPAALAALAAQAGWPLLAEPSSGARQGPTALSSYPYLLDSAAFASSHRPDLIISAGRPGLSRGQLALLRAAGARHIVLRQGPGRWSDPARTANEVAASVGLRGVPREGPAGTVRSDWLRAWLEADAAARRAADEVLAADGGLSEPLLAREVAAALPAGGLLWAASSMPVRDLDRHMITRPDVRILANRGTSGIDGLVSSAIGAALAHQAGGGGPAVALLGDLALLHDSPGLVLGPLELRPDLCLIVVNNDGGGIFSTLEQAAFPDAFERVFGTPHGADLSALAAATGMPYSRLEQAGDLPEVLSGGGLRLVEVRTDRAEGAKLRAAIAEACTAAIGPN